MAGAAVLLNASEFIADAPQIDANIAPNFERFDGLMPLENPAGWQRTDGGGSPFRPGQSVDTPDVYTPGPLSATVGTLGGQPLPAIAGEYRPEGQTTLVNTPSIQKRMGVGQNGPSALGAAQTTQLSEITNAPPVPGELSGIIAGLS